MNNLLPKSEGDFSETSYWENFFKTRQNSFEWYGEYLSLLDLFVKYVKPQDKILVVGCGNSTLSEDLYTKHNCRKIVSIDTSATAINQMITKNNKKISRLGESVEKTFDFLCMDASNFLCYENINIHMPLSCVIDKGTTDAIHSGGSTSTSILESMWSAIEKSLTFMGRYILITLAQEHIVESVVNFFTAEKSTHSWMINVHELAQSKENTESFKLPIFAFVFYKMKYNPSLPLVYIEDNSFSSSVTKSQKILLKSPKSELVKWVLSRQRLAMLCNTITTAGRNDSVIDMESPSTGLIRYHCVLTHNKTPLKKKGIQSIIYCVFIVPFGHDRSAVFNGERSRLSLMRDHLNCSRCLFVYLNQREYYSSKEAIQNELQSVTLKFCPGDAPKDYSVPVISSTEEVCASGVSALGSLVVETVCTEDGLKCRRLISEKSVRPIMMANAPLSVRDQVIQKWIRILCGLDSKALYLGRPMCVDTLDKRWTILESDCADECRLFTEGKVSLSLLSDVLSGGVVWNTIVCDESPEDAWSLAEVIGLISERGVVVSCGTRDALALEGSAKVCLECRVTETFASESTFLRVISSRNDIDIKSLRAAYDVVIEQQ